MLNGSAAALIGFYLLTVLYNDKQDQLLKAIREESGIIKWSGAMLLLYYLYRLSGGKVGEIIQQLTLLALVALLLNKGAPIIENISKAVEIEPGDQTANKADMSPSQKYMHQLFGK